MKKVLPLLLVLTVLLALVACGKSGGNFGNGSLAGTYDIKVWVADGITDLTQKQIDDFNVQNTDGIKFNAVIQPVSEGDIATQLITDVEAAGDIFVFAQDQFARLIQAGALAKLGQSAAEMVNKNNIPESVAAVTLNGELYGYPLTADNGYFMYYDTSVIPDADVDSLEKLIEDCEAAGKYFCMEVQTNGWYITSFFFGTGCVSEWTIDDTGTATALHDTFDVVPQKWGLDNYAALFKSDFKSWYLNTVVIALANAILQTVITLSTSYAMSRFRFKLRGWLMRFMLVFGMFPGMLTMIILYRVLKDIGLTETHTVPGLILVYAASAGMGYYVSKGFFDTIPRSLDEAARVDGATRLQVLTRIMLPLAKPIVIYTILTAFMAPWGDFVFARYISFNNPVGMNVAVGMYNWLTVDQINKSYTMFCAGGVVVAIPVTILFLFLQRYYVEGVTGGAVKG